ncbi:MAG TPA: hypothetical protein VKU94_06380 [Geobacterales bacterium]|nr:hypothetical protein [Geobacterales bacterium]
MFKKLLSLFAMFEGIDHLILSAISFYGFYIHGIGIVHYLSLWIAPLADTLFGFISIATGLALRSEMKKKEVK